MCVGGGLGTRWGVFDRLGEEANEMDRSLAGVYRPGMRLGLKQWSPLE